MKLQFTKKYGLLLLLIGLGIFFLPYMMAVTKLGAMLPFGSGDGDAMPVIVTFFACWAFGILIAFTGLLLLVILPFKAKPGR